MDRNLPIGILDSGVGGLTAVVQMKNALPDESVIYFGDSKRMPYGNREDEEIVFLANHMIAYLEEIGVKAILLACNTISSLYDRLESTVPLFSIVDAGARAVTQTDNKGTVGVIATCSTINSGIYEKTIAAYDPSIHVVANSSASLPKIIDSQLEEPKLLDAKIRECLDPIVQNNDSVAHLLLGCSHFPIIKEEINAIYPQLMLLDPAEEQVRILRDYLEANDMRAENNEKDITLYTTAETYEYAAAIKRLKLEIDTLMKVPLLEEDR